MSTAYVLKAVRFLRANRGPIHANSGAFKRTLEEVRASDNPMATAKARLKSMLAVRRRETYQGLIGLAHTLIERQGLNTTTLDALVAKLREGYPNQRLDPQHHQMIERFEAQLFAEKVKPDDLIGLIERLVKVAAYDQARGWQVYRADRNPGALSGEAP